MFTKTNICIILCAWLHVGLTFAQKKTEQRFENQNLFVQAVNQFISKDYDKALETLQTCEKKLGSNHAIHFKKAEIYFYQKEYEKAHSSIQKAIKLKEKIYYYELKLEILYQLQNFEEVPEVYEKLFELGAQEDYYISYANFLSSRNQFKEAIEVLDKFENQFGLNEFVVKKKQANLLKTGNFEGALAEGERLVTTFPNNKQYPLNQIELLIKYQKIDEALKRIEQDKVQYPNEPWFDLYASQVYFAKGDMKKYSASLQRAIENPNLSVKVKMSYLTRFVGSRQKLLQMVSSLQEHHPEEGEVDVFYADVLFENKKYPQARSFYEKAIEKGSHSFQIWNRLLRLDEQLRDLKAISKHSEEAIEMFPNQFIFYLYKGSSSMQMSEYEEAKEILEQGIYLVEESSISLIQFHQMLANVYHELQEYEQSDSCFEKILTLDNRNVTALNNYSYFLSLRKQKLDKAKVMVEQLMKLSPNVPAYLDTAGWVLYQMGDFAKAKTYLEEAALRSQDATIIEHLGDALYQLGEKEKALLQWKKAKVIGEGYSKFLDKKIETGALVD